MFTHRPAKRWVGLGHEIPGVAQKLANVGRAKAAHIAVAQDHGTLQRGLDEVLGRVLDRGRLARQKKIGKKEKKEERRRKKDEKGGEEGQAINMISSRWVFCAISITFHSTFFLSFIFKRYHAGSCKAHAVAKLVVPILALVVWHE